MHFKEIITTTLVAAGLASSFLIPHGLPDGAWEGGYDAEGNEVIRSISDPDYPEIVTRAESNTSENPAVRLQRSAKAGKRQILQSLNGGTECWSSRLNHPGVDKAVIELKNYLGGSKNYASPSSGTWWYGYNEGGAYVYICVDTYNAYAPFSADDVTFGLKQMDGQCGTYSDGYYVWGADIFAGPWNGLQLGRKIFGMCVSGTGICQGNNFAGKPPP